MSVVEVLCTSRHCRCSLQRKLDELAVIAPVETQMESGKLRVHSSSDDVVVTEFQYMCTPP